MFSKPATRRAEHVTGKVAVFAESRPWLADFDFPTWLTRDIREHKSVHQVVAVFSVALVVLQQHRLAAPQIADLAADREPAADAESLAGWEALAQAAACSHPCKL